MFSLDSQILILDDMPTIRDLVRKQLRSMGFKNITEAQNGQEGWDLLETAYGAAKPFDLVISDWMMPQLRGIELLQMVREDQRFAKLPFVLLTSEADRDQVTEAVLLGVSQYIVKPFSAKVFEEKLLSAFQKHNKK